MRQAEFIVILGCGRFNPRTLPIYERDILILLEPVRSEAKSVAAGSVLIRRGRDGYVAFATLGSAINFLVSAIMTYDPENGEPAVMRALRGALDEFSTELNASPRRGYRAAAEFESRVASLAATLSGSRNPFKASARRKLMAAANTRDRLGRRNPGRQQMLFGHTDRDFSHREKQLPHIRKRLAERLTELLKYYQANIAVILDIREALTNSLGKPGGDPDAPLGEWALPECRRIIGLLPSLRANPFLGFRNLALGRLQRAVRDIQAERHSQARAEIVTVRDASRLTLAHLALGAIAADVRNADESHVPHEGLAEKLASLLSKLRKINPVKELRGALQKAVAHVGQAVRFLKERKPEMASESLKAALAVI
jgi:hypothetical protein